MRLDAAMAVVSARREAALRLVGYGFLRGGLYGSILSLLHVASNRLTAARDGVIVWMFFVVLYGALSAAAFAGAGMALRVGERLGLGRGRTRTFASDVFTGSALFDFSFWFLFFNYGLTYDEFPFGQLSGVGGMLAFLAARTLLVAIGTLVLANLSTRLVVAWSSAPPLRTVWLAVALLALHAALPVSFRMREPASAAAARAQDPTAVRNELLAETSAARTGLKVILLGFDGADWRVIDPLVADGRLPNFARLTELGTRASLTTLAEANSAMIWASIYTGTPVAEHGIEDFYRVRLAGMTEPGGLFPVHRTFFKELVSYLEPLGLATRSTMHRGSLRRIPIWEVLNRMGLSIGVIDGYYCSYPAFTPMGASSYFLAYGLAGEYKRLVRSGGAVDGERLRAYLQPPALLASIAPHLRDGELAWQSTTALELLRTRDHPQFVNLYSRAPDDDQHRYWKWYQPQYFLRANPRAVERLGNKIPRAYEAIDGFLGRVMELADANTVVIVISDHGHSPTILHAMQTQHRHGPPGILAMAGGPVKRGSVVDRAHVFDVFPTVLHLLGLAVPEDGAGRVLVDALDADFVRQHPVRWIHSYQPLATDGATLVEEDTRRNREEIEKLRALGYIR